LQQQQQQVEHQHVNIQNILIVKDDEKTALLSQTRSTRLQCVGLCCEEV